MMMTLNCCFQMTLIRQLIAGRINMVILVKMNKEEKQVASAYAKRAGMSLNKAIKKAFFEKIEDEYDIAIADAALREYEKNPKTYTLQELTRELNINKN